MVCCFKYNSLSQQQLCLRERHTRLEVKGNLRLAALSHNITQPTVGTVHRSIVILPGLGNNSADYAEFSGQLQKRVSGTVRVANVQRWDWLRNAAGLRYGAYWRGTLAPQPTVNWYLDRINVAIDLAKRDVGENGGVTLVAHSAGGWLARVYMKAFGTMGIDKLVTLGSPHLPAPEGTQGVVDQTRGILKYCEQEIPGAYHNEIQYTTIAGKYRLGVELNMEGTLEQKLVGLGYKQICGRADVWGDGIVPRPSSHLNGAVNIDIDGAYHSPIGSSEARPWYGSVGIMDEWVSTCIDTNDYLPGTCSSC
eukprot:TRINITY_DN31907_c0_g2_i1.p1 TRINITY_DN31907_c0_g2~~TRINITY_DN31907_c0_g2_i1.p1  ORF type:complete len:308 (-),score=10.97 TRINITY_DN31907_c0_g2_i1:304-1227(-)